MKRIDKYSKEEIINMMAEEDCSVCIYDGKCLDAGKCREGILKWFN